MTLLMIEYSFKKKLLYILVILLLTSSFYPIMNVHYINKDTTQHELIRPIKASRDLSSYDPRAFKANSGRTHLLFSHEVQNYDHIRKEYYLSYELSNGNWSLPQKVFKGVQTIFDISAIENGFVVYYYNEGISKREYSLCKREYNEQADRWSDELELFGKSQIINYLNLLEEESREIYWWIHSFHSLEDESFFIAWSFQFWHDSNFTHENEDFFFVSKVDPNGSIVSQPIQGYKGQYNSKALTFVMYGNNTFLYDRHYNERTTHFSNGTWSSWQDTVFTEIPSYSWGKCLAVDQYLFCYEINRSNYKETWSIADLAKENLSVMKINFPHLLANSTIYHIDLDFNPNSKDDLVFDMALIINQRIELWEFDFLNDNWTQIASFDYNIKSSYSSDNYNIDLVRHNTKWYVFWDQKLDESIWLHEIFVVSYSEITNEWSPVIQITDENAITDDYTGDFPTFTFVVSFIGIMTVFIFLRRRKLKLFERQS